MITIKPEKLIGFVSDIFARAGSSKAEAGRVASYLVTANLTGHDSHGVIRVPKYVAWVQDGSIIPDQTIKLEVDTPSLAVIDGGFGFGQTVTPQAVRVGIDKCKANVSVLCPPHLVEQWVGELKLRFGFDAVAVTSGSAARLERGLPLAQTLFDAYPYTVVSLDYIKAEKRREGFARACPDFVIVDEAHASVGTHKGKQQRFELLAGLARDPERRMIFLTATPHSGDEDAFGRLLSLIDPSFGTMNFEDARYRERLARHFVQRQRIDLVSGDWDENRAFPKHETTESPYRLSQAHLDFQDAVLDYCFGVVSRAGSGLRERRLAF